MLLPSLPKPRPRTWLLLSLLFCLLIIRINADIWEERADAVRAAVAHAWRGYKGGGSISQTYYSDEVRPLSRTGFTWLYGRVTFYDSLDTLYLSGLTSEFREALDAIAHGGMPETGVLFPTKTFEYHLRVIGGLLGAYSVSGERTFLETAKEAMDEVLSKRGDSGLVYPAMRIISRKNHPISWFIAYVLDWLRYQFDDGISYVSLAGAGSFGVELRSLALELDDPYYAQVADEIFNTLTESWFTQPTSPSWLPLFHSLSNGVTYTGSASLGSGGDSFYEYLLKEYLFESGKNPNRAKLYDWVVQQILDKPIIEGYPVYSTHLEGFVPGFLALGSTLLKGGRNVDLEKAKAILQDFILWYELTPTGLSGEYPNGRNNRSMLRPEVIESIFILWRITGDPYYREIGWKIFQSFEKYCKVPRGGYTGLKDVFDVKNNISVNGDDLQPSFFIAETLKYLLLLFSPNDLIPLENYVFTTEAHPLPIKKRCAHSDTYEPPCRPSKSSWTQVSIVEWGLLIFGIAFIIRKVYSCFASISPSPQLQSKSARLDALWKVRSE